MTRAGTQWWEQWGGLSCRAGDKAVWPGSWKQSGSAPPRAPIHSGPRRTMLRRVAGMEAHRAERHKLGELAAKICLRDLSVSLHK